MSEKKIPIEQASEAQLRTFAETYLGINMPANTKLETMQAKVRAAWSKDEILVEAEDAKADDSVAPEGTPPQPVTAQQKPPGKEKVRIIIQRTDEPGGDEAVPVGVNGRVMLIPRGEEVDIPKEYFEVLQHAITHRYDSLVDGGINPIPRKVPAYPFQRIG